MKNKKPWKSREKCTVREIILYYLLHKRVYIDQYRYLTNVTVYIFVYFIQTFTHDDPRIILRSFTNYEICPNLSLTDRKDLGFYELELKKFGSMLFYVDEQKYERNLDFCPIIVILFYVGHFFTIDYSKYEILKNKNQDFNENILLKINFI